MSDKLSNDILWWKPNNRPLPEEYKIKHMKTHAEFLEELKEYVKENQFFGDHIRTGYMANLIDADDVIDKIEAQLRDKGEEDEQIN
jgi:arylsulfatase A-like enzyme